MRSLVLSVLCRSVIAVVWLTRACLCPESAYQQPLYAELS